MSHERPPAQAKDLGIHSRARPAAGPALRELWAPALGGGQREEDLPGLRGRLERNQRAPATLPGGICHEKSGPDRPYQCSLPLWRQASIPNARTSPWASSSVEEWLPVTQSTIRSTTHASYATHVKKHILPTLGRVKLQKLTPVMINSLYAQLLKDGKVCGSGGLSANSVRRVHATLHRALNDAVRWDRLFRNPCDAADPPRLGADREEKTQAWTNLELRKFLEAVKNERLYPLWLTLAMTGLRRGEALALRWADVDLERARLSVRRSLVPINGTVEVHEPKTSRGRRLVALDPFTVSVLRAWSCRQKEERLESGPAWTDSGLVFTRTGGKVKTTPLGFAAES